MNQWDTRELAKHDLEAQITALSLSSLIRVTKQEIFDAYVARVKGKEKFLKQASQFASDYEWNLLLSPPASHQDELNAELREFPRPIGDSVSFDQVFSSPAILSGLKDFGGQE